MDPDTRLVLHIDGTGKGPDPDAPLEVRCVACGATGSIPAGVLHGAGEYPVTWLDPAHSYCGGGLHIVTPPSVDAACPTISIRSPQREVTNRPDEGDQGGDPFEMRCAGRLFPT